MKIEVKKSHIDNGRWSVLASALYILLHNAGYTDVQFLNITEKEGIDEELFLEIEIIK